MTEKYAEVFKSLMNESPPAWMLKFYDLMQVREHPKYPKLKNGGRHKRTEPGWNRFGTFPWKRLGDSIL